ncbi:SUKH-4 family immunity protein [Streptomyces sp. NPDC047917]|uniref:SUKH-4 family immunity protein n=1 Tax=Streptomyces sp. NPDC047917 TaxID=3365491 RepID=UPI00371F078B
MLDHHDLASSWGSEGLVYIPLEKYRRFSKFDASLLSPGGAVPAELPSVFTTRTDGPAKSFSLIEIKVGKEDASHLVTLGAAPHDNGLLFCLDMADGGVALLSLDDPAIERVNSSLLTFVEFLTHLKNFSDANTDRMDGARRITHLRRKLTKIDAHAFSDPESWWSIAFTQLEKRYSGPNHQNGQ